jgi:hypothetical protein
MGGLLFVQSLFSGGFVDSNLPDPAEEAGQYAIIVPNWMNLQSSGSTYVGLNSPSGPHQLQHHHPVDRR